MNKSGKIAKMNPVDSIAIFISFPYVLVLLETGNIDTESSFFTYDHEKVLL